MKLLKLSIAVVAISIMAACASKKSTTTSTAETKTTEAPKRIGNGVFAPQDEQLTAIKTKYPNATMSVLNEGHTIYTGACTNCHATKSIYKFSEQDWPGIIESMSKKAKLTVEQKEALTQYVFSIKMTQPASAPNK